MKKIVIIFILLLENTYAQKQSIKIEYNAYVSFTPAIINNDKGILYVENEKSYYKTIFDNVSQSNSLTEDEHTIMVPAEAKEYFSEIYMDLEKGILYENLFERRVLKKYYSVVEPLPKMEWKLLNETKNIAGFKCKKAITTFRGRTYIAWYTESVPLTVGPWKFNGLPGLILSVEDTLGVYQWNISTITYPFSGKIDFQGVQRRHLKFKNITYLKLDKKIIKGLKMRYEVMKSRSQIGGTYSFSFSTKQWREPYNKQRTQTQFVF